MILDGPAEIQVYRLKFNFAHFFFILFMLLLLLLVLITLFCRERDDIKINLFDRRRDIESYLNVDDVI